MATFKSLVISFCQHGDALQADALALQNRGRTMSYPDFNDASARVVGERYNVKPYESRKATEGRKLLTFEKDSAPQQRLERIRKLHPLYGKSGGEQPSNKRAPAPVRARVVKTLADATVASIIKAGLTRAELSALIDAIKGGVSFE